MNTKSRRRIPTLAALVALASLASPACGSARTIPPAVRPTAPQAGAAVPATPAPAAPSPAAPAATESYRIQTGDQLAVKLFYHPTLNEEVTVRPDGRISLQLVDEVVAAGVTPGELSGQLRELYSRSLESPVVSVIVKTFSAHRIYVAGEVGNPSEHPLLGPTTALQAVALAGGFKDTARLTHVVVVRRNPDHTARVSVVNLKRVVDGHDPAGDVLLEPYDVVWVPRSTIANVNKFVKEFIVNNIPVDFGIRFDVVP